jgi:hypothetical protein
MSNNKKYKNNKIGDHELKPETMMMSYGYDPELSEGSVKPPIFLKGLGQKAVLAVLSIVVLIIQT